MKRLAMFSLVSLAALSVGCGVDPQQSAKTPDIETATYVAALEVNEDGSDADTADFTRPGPRLLKGCGFGRVRDHLVREFDEDGSGDIEGHEGDAMDDAMLGEVAEASGDAGSKGFGRHRHGRHRIREGMLLEIYDTDGDGALSDEEREAIKSDLEARCENRLAELTAEFDADGDGALSDEEWAAAHSAIRERFAVRRAEFIAKFDADGDGELSREERGAAHAEWEGKRQGRHDVMAGSFDADGDGQLDADEEAAFTDARRGRVRGEGAARPEGERPEKPEGVEGEGWEAPEDAEGEHEGFPHEDADAGSTE